MKKASILFAVSEYCTFLDISFSCEMCRPIDSDVPVQTAHHNIGSKTQISSKGKSLRNALSGCFYCEPRNYTVSAFTLAVKPQLHSA